MNDSGLLIVVSGPSGAGKGTICSALREQFPNIQYSISMTTRKPRPGEVDGVNYYFADNARFEQLLAEDAFLEHAKVYDHYYGTPKKYVYQMLEEGKHVMLEYQSSKNLAKSLYALDNLWDGLGALTLLIPNLKYFFGKMTMYPSQVLLYFQV